MIPSAKITPGRYRLTFDGLHGRPKIIQILIKDFLERCDRWGLRERPTIDQRGTLAWELLTRMRLAEELFGNLAKVVDEADGCVLLQWVINAVGKHTSHEGISTTESKIINFVLPHFLKNEELLCISQQITCKKNQINIPYHYPIITLPVNIHISLVEEVMEDINSLDCRLSLLLVPKYQVNPFMQVCWDIVTLQGCSVQANEFPCIAFGPWGKHNIV